MIFKFMLNSVYGYQGTNKNVTTINTPEKHITFESINLFKDYLFKTEPSIKIQHNSSNGEFRMWFQHALHMNRHLRVHQLVEYKSLTNPGLKLNVYEMKTSGYNKFLLNDTIYNRTTDYQEDLWYQEDL